MARGRNHHGVPRRVQRFSGDNQMNTHNLAIVFGPTLFQTDGKDYKAGRVVEDLISHYVKIFNVGLDAQNSNPKKLCPWVGAAAGPLAPARADARVAPQGMGAAGGRRSGSSPKFSLFWRHTGWGLHPHDPQVPLLGRSTTKR